MLFIRQGFDAGELFAFKEFEAGTAAGENKQCGGSRGGLAGGLRVRRDGFGLERRACNSAGSAEKGIALAKSSSDSSRTSPS